MRRKLGDSAQSWPLHPHRPRRGLPARSRLSVPGARGRAHHGPARAWRWAMARHECLDTQALTSAGRGERPFGPDRGSPRRGLRVAGCRPSTRPPRCSRCDRRAREARPRSRSPRCSSSSSTKALRKRTTATGSAIFLPSCSITRGRAPGARRGRRREQSPHRRRIASSTRILPGAGDRRRDDHRLPCPRSQRCGAIPEESNKICAPDARRFPCRLRAAGRER